MGKLIVRGYMFFVALMLCGIGAASAQDTGRIDGVVRYNGNPVAGVEVFLGIVDDPFVARYVCTNDSGEFSFTGLPVNGTFIVAAGVEVDFAERCTNPLLLDLSNRRVRQPLLTQSWQGRNGYGERDLLNFPAGSSTLNLTFDLIPWQTNGDNLLNGFIRSATTYFQRGDLTSALSSLDAFKNIVRLYRLRRMISSENANLLNDHADDYMLLFTELIR